jgi:5-methyltetrahydrofolate--homocysteine methyltransferase
MWTTNRGTALTVIGENIHATRVVLRAGKYGTTTPDGRPAVRFTDASGVERLLPLPGPVLESQDFANGRVKQVAAAIVLAMDGGPEAEVGIAFLRALATRQAAAGADYLDLNVDEVTSDSDGQQAAMRWLVQTIEAVATVPLALDSSSAAVIAAGLAASRRARGTPLLNSASLERLDVLDLAAAQECPVVVSAAGRTQMPTGADERVTNALAVVEEARSRGIRVGDIYIDPLVLPIGMDPEVGGHFLAAIARLRHVLGPEIRLTGGFSNISFGLPQRHLLNDVFLALAADAGADSGILDPLATDPHRAFAADRMSPAWKLAADVLTGHDEYGAAYLAAYRAGALGGAQA